MTWFRPANLAVLAGVKIIDKATKSLTVNGVTIKYNLTFS